MTSFLITFRETLEAALVVGIVLSYLAKLDKKSWFSIVYLAIIAGLIGSILLGYAFESFLGGFEGFAEEIYEGTLMLLAGVLITWMVVWMLRQRSMITHHLRERVDHHLRSENTLGLFFLVLLAVLREGVETVLFLKASSLQEGEQPWLAFLGVFLAIVLGYLLFKGLRKVPLKSFFTVSSFLLILFAAGLMSHGVHEYQEAGILPGAENIVWNISAYLPEKEGTGAFLKHVFGYNANPSLIEVLVYVSYLGLTGFASYRFSRSRQN